jgi:hypothetical protein
MSLNNTNMTDSDFLDELCRIIGVRLSENPENQQRAEVIDLIDEFSSQRWEAGYDAGHESGFNQGRDY